MAVDPAVTTCFRENCDCLISEEQSCEVEGQLYCCLTCATECTDASCVCDDCRCPKENQG